MADPNLSQLWQDIQALSRIMQNLVSSSSRTVAAQQANAQAYLDMTEEMDDFRKEMTKGQKLNREQQKLVEKAVALKKAELKAAKEFADTLKLAEKAAADAAASDEDKKAAWARSEKFLKKYHDAQAVTTKAASEVTTSMESLAKGTNLAGAAMVWFGSTVKTAITQARNQIVANQGMIEGTGSLVEALGAQQNQALRMYGMTGTQLATMINANRQMVNAMGGTVNTVHELDSSFMDFKTMTGDTEKAYTAMLESMSSFAAKGIKPTSAVLQAYTQDIKKLAAQTGLNEEQARAMYDDMANDVDSIDMLRSARKDERNSILANQRALLQQNIALGMTTEQAKEAAKMLTEMVDAKPLDRLKQAAKVRALSGALGIAGGDEAASAIIAGKRATKDQMAALSQFGNNAAGAYDQAARQGIGSEIFASQLMDKLDLDQYYGKGSPFSATLGDQLAKPIAQVQASVVDASKSAIVQDGFIIEGIADAAKNILSGNHWLGTIASGVSLIATLMIGGKLTKGLGNLAGRILGKGKGLIAGEAGGAAAAMAEGGGAAAANSAKSITSMLGKTVRILGPVAAAGAGIYEANEEYKKNGKAGAAIGTGVGTAGGAWAGAEAGAAIGAIGGPLGILVGGLIGGALGAWGGGKLGKVVGGSFDHDKKKETDSTKDATQATANASDDIRSATMSSADGIAAQLKKMDVQTTTLQQIAALNQRQIDLAEKQLVALTLTDKERGETKVRTNLRRDNKFASTYNYV